MAKGDGKTGRSAKSLLLLLAVAGLAGCAAKSEQECRTADWREQGMRDALAGYPRARFEDNHEACAKAGVIPDQALYFEGWSQGIRQFCTPANGASWGRAGRAYRNSCPPELEAGFVSRYRDGRRVYDAEQQLNTLQNEQRTKQRQLDAAQDDAARNRLRNDLQNVDGRLRNARDELNYAERQLRRS